MTQNQRIILNIATSYGRTLIGIACGIFSMRWVLMALGNEDFGLYGVVGSLVIFVSFLNVQFSTGISRFYAFSIGRANIADNREVGLEECRSWFSIAVFIHTVLPILLVVIGYSIGVKAITSGWFNIPNGKVGTCVWLWRFLMISCFVGMVNVPFYAMYGAKQYIAEVTIYSIAQVIVKTVFVYYMSVTPRDWLRDYGLVMCVIAVVPQVIICYRAVRVFPECRFRFKAILNFNRIKELLRFVWWQMFAGIGFVARHQCLEVIVNKYYGPVTNAAYTVGATVGGESAALTGALNVAFAPAITTKYGEQSLLEMRTMAFRSCKFGTFLTIIFAIPMFLEIDELLYLWLKEPPPNATVFCVGWLCAVVIEKFTIGHCQAVNASGKVSEFMCIRGLACLTAIPLTIGAAMIFKTVSSFCIAFVGAVIINCITDVIFARRVVGMSIRYWIKAIVIPLSAVSLVSLSMGCAVVFNFPRSFMRLATTTIVVEIFMFGLAWLWLLDAGEKTYVTAKLNNFILRCKRNR